MAYFSEIRPPKLSKAHRKDMWVFMLYQEGRHEREDKCDYCGFLFRNNDRTLYGIKEFIGDDIPHMKEFRKLATKVVLEAPFRQALLSDDPELPKIWKRH